MVTGVIFCGLLRDYVSYHHQDRLDCEEISTRRLASRILAREGGCLVTDLIFGARQALWLEL
jgi:hypothetical protein